MAAKIEAVEHVQPTLQQPATLRQPVQVRTVDVTKGPDGIEIQIDDSSPMKSEAMKLKNPDRVVIDLPNAIWNRAPKLIPVKTSDVNAVRIALYRADPPVTRLVVDLPEARDYELVSSGNITSVKLHAPTANKLQPVREPMQSKR